MTDKDRTTLVQRLRDICYLDAERICGEAADELDRLNAQALELCAEISGLRRELGALRDWVSLYDEGLLAEFDRVRAVPQEGER